MKIISTGSLHGNLTKYREVLGLTKQIKPDVLILTGDLFPSNLDSPMEQADSSGTCAELVKEYGKYCDKVFYIFGEQDTIAVSEIFQEIIQEDTNNIHCLNYENYNYGGFAFVGFPFVKDTKYPLKDWVRTDALIVNENNNRSFATNTDFDFIEIEDNYSFIKEQPQLSKIMEEKLSNTNEDRILITHYPPPISEILSETHYNLFMSKYISKFKFIFGGHSDSLFRKKINYLYEYEDTKIFWHSTTDSMILYNFVILVNKRLFYSYFPLNGERDEIVKNATLYREKIKDAN